MQYKNLVVKGNYKGRMAYLEIYMQDINHVHSQDSDNVGVSGKHPNQFKLDKLAEQETGLGVCKNNSNLSPVLNITNIQSIQKYTDFCKFNQSYYIRKSKGGNCISDFIDCQSYKFYRKYPNWRMI